MHLFDLLTNNFGNQQFIAMDKPKFKVISFLEIAIKILFSIISSGRTRRIFSTRALGDNDEPSPSRTRVISNMYFYIFYKYFPCIPKFVFSKLYLYDICVTETKIFDGYEKYYYKYNSIHRK